MKRIFAILLLFLLNSCFDQNDCVDTSSNLVKMDMATSGGVAMTRSFIDVVRDSINGVPDSIQHFKYFEQKDLTSLQLPLDPNSTQSSFSFLTSDSLKFHLRVEYSTFTRVIATDCGAFLYYKDLKIVNTSFDSTQIISPQILKGATTNLKLYF